MAKGLSNDAAVDGYNEHHGHYLSEPDYSTIKLEDLKSFCYFKILRTMGKLTASSMCT